MQIHHMDEESFMKFGAWLLRRWRQCKARGLQAKAVLDDCGYSVEMLEEQWAAQVKVQTRPLPRMFFFYKAFLLY